MLDAVLDALSSLDLDIDELLERKSSALCCIRDLLLRRSLHRLVLDVRTAFQRDELVERRLDMPVFAMPLPSCEGHVRF